MDRIQLHRLLRYELAHSQRAPIDWDFHDPVTSACYRVPPIAQGITLLKEDFAMSATTPSLTSLRIICDVLPYDWPVVARNADGVTIKDVLLAIHDALEKQITMREWSNFADKQRKRITIVFDTRWRRAADPLATRAIGVERVDTLLHHTAFGGLTVIPATEPTCVLTLAVCKAVVPSPSS